MIEVYHTDEFESWYLELSDNEADSVTISIERLEQMGLNLPYPHSSAIEGSKYAIRELRIKAGRSPLRVFYAFDPSRDAILLIGGDKSNDKNFYERYVKKAEAIWREYLRERMENKS
jgi:hypothetical protein